MIDFITQNKGLVIVGVVLLLLFNNRDKFSFILSWPGKVLSFLTFKKTAKTATQDDRKNLYDCLIQLQDYLAICGMDREKMDSMTLAEVGELTVSATTPLKPSRQSSETNADSHDNDSRLLDIQ